MRWINRIAAAALCAALQACVTPPAIAPEPPSAAAAAVVAMAETRAPVTILVSIDGFRPDYLQRGVTPSLNALAAAGVQAAMRPSFPSITFPNHYTLVTGLRPDRNGVVGNKMEDTRRPGEVFTMATDAPFWWAEAEPLWITAEKAGIRSATMFWPGANVDHDGVRPSDWQQYGEAVSNRQRVDSIIDWLRRPADARPKFLTLYFDVVDTAGHKFGPTAPETTAAVGDVDAAIGRLREGLAILGQPANLIIVADHGMAATGSERVMLLDGIANPADYRFIYGGSYGAIEPQPGHEAALAKSLLSHHDHMACYRKADLPPALHYGHNPRVPAFICVVEPGWLLLEKAPAADKPVKPGGAHGYDPASPDMAALFIASGPGIRSGGTLPSFDNVDVAPLLRDLIGLPAGQNLDGGDAPFRGVLVRKP